MLSSTAATALLVVVLRLLLPLLATRLGLKHTHSTLPKLSKNVEFCKYPSQAIMHIIQVEKKNPLHTFLRLLHQPRCVAGPEHIYQCTSRRNNPHSKNAHEQTPQNTSTFQGPVEVTAPSRILAHGRAKPFLSILNHCRKGSTCPEENMAPCLARYSYCYRYQQGYQPQCATGT